MENYLLTGLRDPDSYLSALQDIHALHESFPVCFLVLAGCLRSSHHISILDEKKEKGKKSSL